MTLETGSKGKVVFKAPFDVYNSDKEWTVSGDDTIPHLKSFGIDILDLVYIKNGLTEVEYSVDVINNVRIVAFSDEAQFILYVPSNRIELDSVEHGYEYQEKILGITLPSLPVDYSLAPLIEDLKIIVKEKTGYDVNIGTVSLSGITMVNKADHDVILGKLSHPTIEKRGFKTKYLQEVEKSLSKDIIIEDLKGLVLRLKNNV